MDILIVEWFIVILAIWEIISSRLKNITTSNDSIGLKNEVLYLLTMNKVISIPKTCTISYQALMIVL